MKYALIAAALMMTSNGAIAGSQKYLLDASHSQIVFSYNHLGYSTNYGMFSGFEGEIHFDADAPEKSAVTVSMPVQSMLTGWQARFDHFMNDDFFGAKDGDLVTFSSTSISVTGENTALITGDLSMNGVTKPVVLDAVLNLIGVHPMAKKDWAGFNATTTVTRSEFNLGKFAPFVSDEIEVKISVEAAKAE